MHSFFKRIWWSSSVFDSKSIKSCHHNEIINCTEFFEKMSLLIGHRNDRIQRINSLYGNYFDQDYDYYDLQPSTSNRLGSKVSAVLVDPWKIPKNSYQTYGSNSLNLGYNTRKYGSYDTFDTHRGSFSGFSGYGHGCCETGVDTAAWLALLIGKNCIVPCLV